MELSIAEKDSFIARRQLFKSIWESSVNIDGNSAFKSKHKVIKTLRLSDVCAANTLKRKQEIKKLQCVCNKLLKLHDKQNAGVTNNEEANTSNQNDILRNHTKRKKRIRIIRVKRKIKKKKTLYTQHKPGWKMKKSLHHKKKKP